MQSTKSLTRSSITLLGVALALVAAAAITHADDQWNGTVACSVNGKSSGSAYLLQGLVYVPVRSVAEGLGATVDWDPNAHMVNVAGPNNSQDSPNQSGASNDVSVAVTTAAYLADFTNPALTIAAKTLQTDNADLSSMATSMSADPQSEIVLDLDQRASEAVADSHAVTALIQVCAACAPTDKATVRAIASIEIGHYRQDLQSQVDQINICMAYLKSAGPAAEAQKLRTDVRALSDALAGVQLP
jgi:hypothetical protein